MDTSKAVTWAILLAHWTEYAKASVGFPETDEGDRWRDAVPSIIALQAITMALGEMDDITDASERMVGLSKADIGISEHAKKIHELWRGEAMDMELITLIDDARRALCGAKGAGVMWRAIEDETKVYVGAHPADIIAVLLGLKFRGDLFVSVPGIPMFAGAPVVYLRDRGGAMPHADICEATQIFVRSCGEVEEADRIDGQLQVYRQFDFGVGGPVRDLVMPIEAALPPGQPLLVPAILDGAAQPVTLPPKTIDMCDFLPVVYASGEDESELTP